METQKIDHSIETVSQYMMKNIKDKFTSSDTPSDKIWFKKASANHYLGGNQDVVLHMEDISGVIFTQKIINLTK